MQGCNIPDIDLVVQWKLPSSVSVFVQRAGRAARAAGRTGLAVLLIEPSAYDVNLEELAAKSKVNEKRKRQTTRPPETEKERKRKSRERKHYAKLHGLF